VIEQMLDDGEGPLLDVRVLHAAELVGVFRIVLLRELGHQQQEAVLLGVFGPMVPVRLAVPFGAVHHEDDPGVGVLIGRPIEPDGDGLVGIALGVLELEAALAGGERFGVGHDRGQCQKQQPEQAWDRSRNHLQRGHDLYG
jgi:hypothetical protein